MAKKMKKLKKTKTEKPKFSKLNLRPKSKAISKNQPKEQPSVKPEQKALKESVPKQYTKFLKKKEEVVKSEKPEQLKVESPLIHLPSGFTIKVENVVSFASLGVVIQLDKLVKEVENTEYEPEQFPGLVYRPTNPRAAALIFSSGKIVCTGAKSIENSKLAMKRVAETIGSVGINVPKKFPIEVENIVASSRIIAKLNLEEIAFMLENAEYEPEQFPGLVFRITEPRVAFLLFSSGKIICTGAHSIEDINRALAKFKEKLEEIGIKVTPATD